MSGSTSIQCHQCRGVVTSADSTGYTKTRARLIIEHGYCSCAAPAAQAVPQNTQAMPVAPVRPLVAEPEQGPVYSTAPPVRA